MTVTDCVADNWEPESGSTCAHDDQNPVEATFGVLL